MKNKSESILKLFSLSNILIRKYNMNVDFTNNNIDPIGSKIEQAIFALIFN